MPNNKLVRDCTFGYLRKVGGKFKQLGMAGRPDQIVGKVLADKQAEAIWRKA